MAEDKKNAMRLGAHIVFADESGFLLIPPVRKTWAPRGQTPIIKHLQKHQSISVISALSVSPQRKRIGLFFHMHGQNIHHEEVCCFLRHLLGHLRGHVIVVWDNGGIHKGEPIRSFLRQHPRLRLEAFPPYAPELNPDEGVWSQAKNSLANGRPDSIDTLWLHLFDTLYAMGCSQNDLRACIQQSDLPTFLP